MSKCLTQLLAHYRDELLPKKMKSNNAIYKRCEAVLIEGIPHK